MNLRIVPAIPSQPTVIFSLNWRAPPSSLSLPHYYSAQLVSCQDAHVPVPKNPLVVDKAVGFHLLIDSVTFDLSRQLVSVAWVDGQSLEWSVNEVDGFKQALEDVLECVRLSGVEVDKEKKAAAAALVAKASGHSRSESAALPAATSSSEASSSSSSINGHRRHRTASGIFSSLVASFISPPSSPDLSANGKASSSDIVPDHLSGLYRSRRKGSQVYHRQHVFHPNNKRETLPTTPVAQSRYLRRQARAKLVDIFRLYVASRLTKKMRDAGIVGEELRDRGIMDDLEDGSEVEGETGPMPGTSGYAAAGGYVAYMARSMLRNTLAEVGKDDDADSWSSSDESLLLTPKDQHDAQLVADVPSDCGSFTSSSSRKSVSRSPSPAPSTCTPRSTPRRSSSRASASSPQTQQIRHLSSILIGLTQKDKRATADEREVLDMVRDRSLRRRWSLSETSSTPRLQQSHCRSSSSSEVLVEQSRRSPQTCSQRQNLFGRPLVGSPLRESEAADYFGDVPFPGEASSSSSSKSVIAVPFPTVPAPARRSKSMPSQLPPPSPTVPFDEDAADVTDCKADEIPLVRDEFANVSFAIVKSSTPTKAFEAEDVDRTSGRPRCAALLPATPATSSTSTSTTSPPRSPTETESSDLIAIRDLPALPSTKSVKTSGHSRSSSCPPAIMITFTSGSVSSDDEEMEITDASSITSSSSSEDDGYTLTIPAKTTTIYSSIPKSPSAISPTSPTFQKLVDEERDMVRGLELELETVNGGSGSHARGSDGSISGAYWPHLHDGVFVV